MFFSFFAIFCLVKVCSALYRSGTVSGASGFEYLSKFCFDFSSPQAKDRNAPLSEQSHAGTMDIWLEQPKNARDDMRVIIFDDQQASWPSVYQKDLPCAERWVKAKRILPVVWERNQFELPRVNIHEHTRPRFWYIVVASEDCSPFDPVNFKITFKNSEVGFLNRQFGVNERGLNGLYMIFSVFYVAALGMQFYALYDLWDRKELHPIVQLFTASLVLQSLFVICECVHYAVFTLDGIGIVLLKDMGQLFKVVSQLCFLFLLILLAHGWTISSEEIRNRAMIILTVASFAVAFLICHLWDMLYRDPASTLYVYDSGPGLFVVLLHVLAGSWFAHVTFSSYLQESKETKKYFYFLIGVVYSAWFATVPLIVTFAIVLHPWERETLVASISLSMSTVSYVFMQYLLWPSRVKDFFSINVPDVYKTSYNDNL